MLNPYGLLDINLTAIQENYKIIQNKVGQACTVSAVVKANGFGLGAKEVTGALMKAGCQHFFVATPQEGIELRDVYQSIKIYVLNGFYHSVAQAYLQHDLIPAIGSLNEIRDYAALSEQHERTLPAFLHFNTQMNRQGLGAAEQDELWKDMQVLDGIDVIGVMSHLACADEPDHAMNVDQKRIFQNIVSHFPHALKSISNSFGVFCDTAFHFDMVRPGYALYGGNPSPGKANPMMPVASLKVPVIRTHRVDGGAHVGYGATYTFDKETKIATVSAGYADGILRSLSNQGAFYWKGVRCLIRGRVSMDLTTIDLSDVPEDDHPGSGDYLEVLGTHQTLDDLGADAGTIGYEILTALGDRYVRSYSG